MILLKAIIVKNVWFVTIYLFFRGFKSWNFLYNGCHGLIILCPGLRYVGFVSLNGVDYRYIHDISKSKVVHPFARKSVVEDRRYVKNVCQRNQLFMSDLWLGVISLNNVFKKRYKQGINACSMTPKKMVAFVHVRRWEKKNRNDFYW